MTSTASISTDADKRKAGETIKSARYAPITTSNNPLMLTIGLDALTLAIATALAEERESAIAKLEAAYTPAHAYSSENAEKYRAFDEGQKHIIKRATAAIRAQGES